VPGKYQPLVLAAVPTDNCWRQGLVAEPAASGQQLHPALAGLDPWLAFSRTHGTDRKLDDNYVSYVILKSTDQAPYRVTQWATGKLGSKGLRQVIDPYRLYYGNAIQPKR